MTNKHTPAPWKHKGARIVKCRHKKTDKDPYDFTIAQVMCFCSGDFDGQEQRANATLIAAAPELLEALYKAETYFSEYAAETPASEHMLINIRAAIAKAKGAA